MLKQIIMSFGYGVTPKGAVEQLKDYFTYNKKKELGLEIGYKELFWFVTKVIWPVLKSKLAKII
jgi:hypothetical protein